MLVRLVAAEAWLERALLRAEPVKLELMVVDPTVDTKVDERLVTVETSAEVVTAVDGSDVAPPTPSRPEIVVTPVLVNVEPPLVITVVKVLVATADEEPPKMVVNPIVDVIVEPPVVTTVTMGEVVMAEDTAAEPPVLPRAPPEAEELPEAPAPPPAPPVAVAVPPVAVAAPPLVVAGVAVTSCWAQKVVPNATTCAAAVSFWQC